MSGSVLYSVQGEHSGRLLELNARFKESAAHPKVECPVCGQFDNDWPEREGLCCSCWCAAFQLLTTGRPDGDKEPSLADVQRIIGRIVHDGKEYPAFAERIRKYRESTGTLRRSPATPAIPEQPEPPAIPAAPRKRVKRPLTDAEREYHRQYRESHRAQIIATKRRWYEANKEKALAAVRRWREEHREEWNRYQREHNASRRGGKNSDIDNRGIAVHGQGQEHIQGR